MTILAAVADDFGAVHMIADRRVSRGYSTFITPDEHTKKIIQGKFFLVGISGSVGAAQCAARFFLSPEHVDKAKHPDFLIRHGFSKHLKKWMEDRLTGEFELLLAYPKTSEHAACLITVDEQFSVLHHHERMFSGVASQVAFATWVTLARARLYDDMARTDRARECVAVASLMDNSVGSETDYAFLSAE